MKDKYTEATSVDDTKKIVERNLNVEDDQRNCVDSRKREPGEGEDETQGKTLDKITAGFNKLEIESDDEFTERGPTGGIAVTMAMPNIAQKHLPMGPGMGVYTPSQLYYMVNQPEAAGGRRPPIDMEFPAQKYFRPLKPTAFPEPVMAQNEQMFYNTQNYPGDMNNLSQLTQPMMNGNNISILQPNNGSLNTCNNYVYSATEFHGPNFEIQRHSDPSKSGIESERGSPWSDQAPSPSSIYINPCSFDSGCGQSPMHESQVLPGISAPQYHHIVSPMGNRTTSPESSSGCDSPGHPVSDVEDTGDFFNNAENLADLDVAMEVINEDIAQDVWKKKQNRLALHSQNIFPAQPLIPSTVMQNHTPHRMTMPATVTTTAHGMTLAPVVTTTRQVILIPPRNHMTNLPLILVPAHAKPLPPKVTATNHRKIEPRPQPSFAPTSGVPQHSISENINSKEQQSHLRQLMTARRTVACMTQEDLKKSDDEGDTYLHIAVCKADRYMVQAFLERLHQENLDALVDQENSQRQTPLYLAVFINQPVIVSLLVQFQANVNVLAQNLSIYGKTKEVKAAIHVAASQGDEYHRTLTELLKSKNINVNIVNNNGQTALHCAILAHNKAKMNNSSERIDSVQIIETLIRAGAEPSAQDKTSGKTPLMYAIEKGDLALVEIILKTVEPSKMKSLIKTQAFDGSSCLQIAESLKDSLEMEIWNKLWNSLQSAANG